MRRVMPGRRDNHLVLLWDNNVWYSIATKLPYLSDARVGEYFGKQRRGTVI